MPINFNNDIANARARLQQKGLLNLNSNIEPKKESKNLAIDFYEKGLKPSAQQFAEGIGGIANKTVDTASQGISRIQEAREGLASGKYNYGESAIRGAGGALQSFTSPIAGLTGQGFESIGNIIPNSFKEYIKTKVEPTIEDVKQWYDNQSEEQKRDLQNIGVSTEVLANFIGAKAIKSKSFLPKNIKPVNTTPLNISKNLPIGPVKQQSGIITKLNQSKQKFTNTLDKISNRVLEGDIKATGKPGEELVISRNTVTNELPDLIAKSDDLIRRGLRPSSIGQTSDSAFKQTNNKLREGIQVVSKKQGIAKNGIDALEKAGKAKKEIYKTIKNNNDLVTYETNISTIENNINKFINTEEGKAIAGANPGFRNQINKFIDNLKEEYGDTLSQNQLQKIKQEYNKTIAKTDFAKILQGDNIGLLAKANLSSVLGDIIDDNILNVLNKTNKALNKEYGAVRDLEKALAKRMSVFTRNTQGGLSGLLDSFNVGDIIMGALTNDPKQLGLGAIRKGVLAIGKNAENPNKIIKDLFKLHSPKTNLKQELTKSIQKNFGIEDKKVNLKIGTNN